MQLNSFVSWSNVVPLLVVAAVLSAIFPGYVMARDESPARITVLYDAFGKPSAMKKDWGFSVFIEYGGKRILFDTGNNAGIFAHNVKAKGIDLTKLDFVVVSHRHGDHVQERADDHRPAFDHRHRL